MRIVLFFALFFVYFQTLKAENVIVDLSGFSVNDSGDVGNIKSNKNFTIGSKSKKENYCNIFRSEVIQGKYSGTFSKNYKANQSELKKQLRSINNDIKKGLVSPKLLFRKGITLLYLQKYKNAFDLITQATYMDSRIKSCPVKSQNSNISALELLDGLNEINPPNSRVASDVIDEIAKRKPKSYDPFFDSDPLPSLSNQNTTPATPQIGGFATTATQAASSNQNNSPATPDPTKPDPVTPDPTKPKPVVFQCNVFKTDVEYMAQKNNITSLLSTLSATSLADVSGGLFPVQGPNNASLSFCMGFTYLMLGDVSTSQKEFSKAESLVPGSVSSHIPEKFSDAIRNKYNSLLTEGMDSVPVLTVNDLTKLKTDIEERNQTTITVSNLASDGLDNKMTNDDVNQTFVENDVSGMTTEITDQMNAISAMQGAAKDEATLTEYNKKNQVSDKLRKKSSQDASNAGAELTNGGYYK